MEKTLDEYTPVSDGVIKMTIGFEGQHKIRSYQHSIMTMIMAIMILDHGDNDDGVARMTTRRDNDDHDDHDDDELVLLPSALDLFYCWP